MVMVAVVVVVVVVLEFNGCSGVRHKQASDHAAGCCANFRMPNIHLGRIPGSQMELMTLTVRFRRLRLGGL